MIVFKQETTKNINQGGFVMFHEDDSNSGTILMSFLIGGIVGAGLALLLAPYSGKKLRGKIVDMADDVKDYAADYSKKLKNKIA